MGSTTEVASARGANLFSSGVVASVLVGLIMVSVYFAFAVLQVYERAALSSLGSGQFAYLESLFPSPGASGVIAWQNILLLEVVPFLLFFYLAVRMRIDPLERVWPAFLAAVVVGAALSVLSSVLVFYQPNISHLLLAGSFAVPNSTQGGSPLVASFATPWYLMGNGVLFATLGVTGLSFGSFAGETPYWIVRKFLESSGEEDTEHGDSVELP